MSDFLQKKRNLFFLVLLTTVITLVVTVLGLNKISRLIYSERAGNLGILMEKITQNFDTAMQSHWNDVMFCENQLEESGMASDSVVLERLSRTQRWLSSRTTIMLIDSDKQSYTINETPFPWPEDRVLPEDRDVFISSSGRIIFVSNLDTPAEINGKIYTHVALSWPTDVLNEYFLIANYGGKSMSFILEEDGSQIYIQKKQNDFSNVTDVFSLIKKSKFLNGTSEKDFEQDILNGNAGCVSFEYGGKAHFAVYQKMKVNNWYALLIAPEKNVGQNSMGFMGYIVGYIIAIATLILTLLVVLIMYENQRILQKKEAANTMLRNAAEAEHKANQAKTAFLSSMSHDIRTPMNAIIGMASIAQKNVDDPNHVQGCLDKISLAGHHLLTLINDILDISKIESGRMSLNPIVFSLADSTTNMVNVVRPQIRTKDLQFDVRIHNILHEHVFADELRINQIFINLLSNAVKYTPEGGAISLDLHEKELPEDPKKIQLVFSIQDTGIGMSDEYQKTMYDAFTRANTQTSNKVQGAGLGLAITKQMVDLMHGTIECDSAPGKGTRFTVTLNLEIAEKANRDMTLPKLDTLIVDDDKIFLESASDTLSSMGLVVETSNNGADAINKIAKRHEEGNDYTLVIVDWKMPEMNGLETMQTIREKFGDALPIILVSSYDWTDIETEAIKSGANGFIGKPFFRSTVYYEMKKVLNLESHEEDSDEFKVADLKNLNILVAEDIDVNWDVIQEWLEMYEIKASRAENGKICYEMLSEMPANTFDLVLMDIQMPIMDGKEASRKIRASNISHVNSIPIIAMTADAFAEDIEECLEAGMDGHVAKPVDIENLFQEIRRVLLKRKSEDK